MPTERPGDAPLVIFDAGAFIAWERNDEGVRELVALALSGAIGVHTSSAVIAQVWRGGPRHARLARLLGGDAITEQALDPTTARQIGLLAAETGGGDIVDGHVALLARRREAKVVTPDPHDLATWGLPADAIISC